MRSMIDTMVYDHKIEYNHRIKSSLHPSPASSDHVALWTQFLTQTRRFASELLLLFPLYSWGLLTASLFNSSAITLLHVTAKQHFKIFKVLTSQWCTAASVITNTWNKENERHLFCFLASLLCKKFFKCGFMLRNNVFKKVLEVQLESSKWDEEYTTSFSDETLSDPRVWAL